MKEKSISQNRNIGLDLLRICSMIMIILLHSIDHSGLYESLKQGTMLYYYEHFIFALVQVCVNCFVLISGYFLVQSTFKISKLVSLWIEVVFYSLIIKIIMMSVREEFFSITSLVSCFVPIITGRYWFVTIYFGMYILCPFYNISINAMTKRQNKRLIALLIFLFSGMSSIYPSFAGMNSGGVWGLAWFTVLYFVAAYLKNYYISDGKMKKWILLFLICPFMMIVALFLVQKSKILVFINVVSNWWRYDSLPIVIASVFLMIAFINCRVSCSEKLNFLIIKISAATFGVYLIHAHANICTEEMWQRIGMVSNSIHWWFPIYQLFAVMIIFLICTVVDWIRQNLFDFLRIQKFTNGISEFLENGCRFIE